MLAEVVTPNVMIGAGTTVSTVAFAKGKSAKHVGRKRRFQGNQLGPEGIPAFRQSWQDDR